MIDNPSVHMCGEISEKTRKIQLEGMMIVDDICKKNNIVYWLESGTLLGAIRHGGFIPWDDDVDIAMLEPDYRTFIRIAPDLLKKTSFILQVPGEKTGYTQYFAKLRHKNSLFIEQGDLLCETYCKGIYVDIFPMGKYPKIHKNTIRRLNKRMIRWSTFVARPQKISVKNIGRFIRYCIGTKIIDLMYFILNGIVPAQRVGLLPRDNSHNTIHELSDVIPCSCAKFESYSFPIPRKPDVYLSKMYGDYMAPPPLEKRHGHAIVIIDEWSK